MDSVGATRVGLARGSTRSETVATALAAVQDETDFRGVRHLLVKPNFVSTRRQLAATHVDAVRAVLQWVRRSYGGPITIGEGPAASPARAAFDRFGYRSLVEDFGVRLVDLNEDEPVPIKVLDRRLRPLTLYLARTVVEADYRISVGPPKTHDTVVVTLTIKNLVMGALLNAKAVGASGRGPLLTDSLVRRVPGWLWRTRLAEMAKRVVGGRRQGSSKMAMHQSIPVINLNLALVASAIWPHLAVLDGWQGMEGPGPTMGDPVDWRIALAGTDALAVDVVGAHLMGFDPSAIGYLNHCGRLGLGVAELALIDVITDVGLDEFRRAFRPHPALERQWRWRAPGIERYLRPCCVSWAGSAGAN